MVNTNATYDRMKEELAKLKSEMSWLDDSFLLEPEINSKIMYGYLKNNPGASEFVFQKYQKLRPIIAEICDSRNPLYLKGVADNLKSIIDIESIKEDITTLQNKKSYLQNDIDLLQKEIDDKSKEYGDLEEKIPNIASQLNELQRQIANLTTDEALQRIKSFYDSVLKFIENIFESRNKMTISESFGSLKLDVGQINTLKLLQEKGKNDINFISNEDLISQDKLDELRRKIKEDMEREKEDGLKAMDSFMAYNPRKTLSRSLEKIDLVAKQLSQGMPMDGNTVGFYMHGINTITENLSVPRQLLGNLLNQVDNVERRKK